MTKKAILATTCGSNTLTDVEKLRAEYHKIKNDHEALKVWLQDKSYLKTSDFTIITELSLTNLYKLRKKLGIANGRPVAMPRTSRKVSIVIDLPPNWRSKEWLEKALETYSPQTIANSAGLHRSTVVEIIMKHGLKLKSVRESLKSKHKCYNKEWCHKHYVELGYNAYKCSKLAGVTRPTFLNWLCQFGISQRTKREVQMGRKETAIWIHRFLYDLKKQGHVIRRLYHRKDHIHVRFFNYFWETYYFNEADAYRSNGELRPYSYPVTELSSAIKRIPAVVYEYEGSLGSGEQPHTGHIKIDDDGTHTFLEKRLALHEFVGRINKSWNSDLEYSEEVLKDDWAMLQKYSLSEYQDDGKFRTFKEPGDFASLYLLLHFFGLKEERLAFRSPKITTKLCNTLMESGKLINTTNLVKALTYTPYTYRAPKYRYRDPRAYALVFKHFGLRGTVLDPTPGLGYKAMACALLGLKYYTLPDPIFDCALNKGFAKFIGLNHSYYNNEIVDVIWYDNNHSEPDMKFIKPYLNKGKRLFMFVPVNKRYHIESKYKPHAKLKINHTGRTLPDYYMLW